MDKLFSFLWTSALELTALLFIIGILVFLVVKVTLFFVDFKVMGARIGTLEVRMTNVENRLTNVENRLTGLEEQFRLLNTKVDRIIEYLIDERSPDSRK
jgi:hypothetical protein